MANPNKFHDKLGDHVNLSSELASFAAVSHEVASQMFPEVSLSQSESVVYFPFKLCHSLPTVNKRGRCFTPRVLANSFASLQDQLVDLDHALSDHDAAQDDRIIGHVKAVKFDYNGEIASSIPQQAIPVVGLGCLFKRASGVEDILHQYSKNNKSWQVSMECGHKWEDAVFLVDDEFVSLIDAPDDMIDCVDYDHVKPYKGKKLSVCLGGLDKHVDFWGAALTPCPADEHADVLGFVSARNRELSSRKQFFMPFKSLRTNAREVASDSSKKIQEIANIGILGETEPGGDDNHTHMILNDGTIMPANNHMHHKQSELVLPGRKPRLTGVTDAYHAWMRVGDTEQHFVHNHTFDIDLSKKMSGQKTEDPESDMANGDINSTGKDAQHSSDVNISHYIVKIGNQDMKLQELLEKMTKELASLGSQAQGEQQATIKSLHDLAAQFGKLNAEEEFKKRVDAEIAQRVENGALLTKEKADEAVEEAVKEKQEEFDAEQKRQEAIAARLEKCREAKIDLDFEFDGFQDDSGNPLTVKSRVESFSVDEAGEREFCLNFAAWKQAMDASNTDDSDNQTAQTKEAANSPKKKMVPVGGSSSGDDKDTLGFGNKPDGLKKHNAGAFAFSNLKNN